MTLPIPIWGPHYALHSVWPSVRPSVYPPRHITQVYKGIQNAFEYVYGWLVMTIFRYLRQREGYTIISVCLSFSLSVCRITAKVISRFRWNLMLWLGYLAEKNWLTFGNDPVRIRIPGHHVPYYWNFRRFISISHTVADRLSRHSAKWLTPTS